MKKLMLIILALLWQIAAAAAETLTASVDSTEVPMGEVFNLNLSYDGKNGASLQPDLSVLQDDFSIYSTSSSSQISYVNGQSSELRDWDIGLLPKHDGNITIPAVSAGKYKSQPLQIKVLPQGTASASGKAQNKIKNDNQLAEANKFSVDLAINLQQPYVQQEVNAVLTIKDKIGLQLTSEPQFVNAENWIIKPLQKPVIKQQNGETEIKFYYAMFPQKSGKQDLPAAKINGFYMGFDQAANHPLLHQGVNSLFQLMNVDFDEMFGTQKPVELYTKAQTIEVLPAAAEYGAKWWLPSDEVKVKALWNEKKPLFKVGETVARQIIILASGVAETQLPEISFQDDENFKVYPENPELEAKIFDGRVIAQSVTRVVYIPQKGGEQILPEIRVPWYNIKTKKVEMAVIPAEKVFVEGTPAAENQPAENVKAAEPENPFAAPQQNSAEPLPQTAESGYAVNILWVAAAFAAGLLASLLLRRPRQAEKTCRTGYNWCAVLRKNLADNDYRLLRDNLLLWGNETFAGRNIANLEELAKVVANEDFSGQLRKLNQNLYAGAAEKLDDGKIMSAVKECRHPNSGQDENEPLPKLYK